MNNDLDTILKTLERERGISRADMLATIAAALQTAAKKSLGTSGDVRVEIDPHSLSIKAWERRVVDDGAIGTGYITLADARRVNPDAQIGDTVETEVNPRVFGRIAAQTAKQAIVQGMHESERDIMQRRYAGRVGEIVTATVLRTNRKDIICDIQGGGEAILKGRDRMKSDRYNVGESFRAVIRFVGMEQDPRRLDDGLHLVGRLHDGPVLDGRRAAAGRRPARLPDAERLGRGTLRRPGPAQRRGAARLAARPLRTAPGARELTWTRRVRSRSPRVSARSFWRLARRRGPSTPRRRNARPGPGSRAARPRRRSRGVR